MAKTLTPTAAEKKVIAAAANGEVADFSAKDPKTGMVEPNDPRNDPANGAGWGKNRTVRAEIIYDLCVGTGPKWPVHAKGVHIVGAKITNALDFESATLRCPLALWRCSIEKPITFRDARTRGLYFDGSHVPGLVADGLIAKGDVNLRNGFTAKGEVWLLGANIRGDLSCTGGTFENPGGRALSADRLVVRGGVFLSGKFNEKGQLRQPFIAKGEVRLLGADICGIFDCSGGTFENPGGDALSADGLSVKGSVHLRDGFTAKGAVRLLGADIGGSLNCPDGTFDNPSGNALSVDRLVVKGGVFLHNGFTAKGAVRLPGADIGGNLDCSGGTFENPDGNALSADGLYVKGDINLRSGFTAEGAVRLLGADIGGSLNCPGGTFDNSSGNALSAAGLHVKGDINFGRGFTAKGGVLLMGADIGGDLFCQGATFQCEHSYAFTVERAAVKGTLWWTLAQPPKGAVSFYHARVGQLLDDAESWPEAGNLHLDGFDYGALAPGAPIDATSRKSWLLRQPKKVDEKTVFYPQPYEHLIRVLRRMGHERDAREIAIAKQEDLRESGLLSRRARLWNKFLGFTIGHGYKPWKVFRIMIPVVAFGWLMFWVASSGGYIAPTKTPLTAAVVSTECTKTYPCFQSLAYSLDVFLPIVDLHQETYWLPTKNRPYGWLFIIYMWLHIAAGWVLTTIFVVGLTGIIRKD